MRFFNLEVSATRSVGAGAIPPTGNRQGLSVRLDPPGIYKNNKEIEIDSIQSHHVIKAVVNPLHEKATGALKEKYANMINYVDQKMLNRAIRAVDENRIMIFGKPYDVPNAKKLAEDIKTSIRKGDDKAAQSLIDSVVEKTIVRKTSEGDINRDGKIQYGESVAFEYKGQKLVGFVFGSEVRDGKTFLLMTAKPAGSNEEENDRNIFSAQIDNANRGNLSKTKIVYEGPRPFKNDDVGINLAKNHRATLLAQQFLNPSNGDPYGLSKLKKSDLHGFTRIMQQMEADMKMVLTLRTPAGREIEYLEKIEEKLKAAGIEPENIQQLMGRLLRSSIDKNKNLRNDFGGNAVTGKTLEAYCHKRGIKLDQSIDFTQIWNLIKKPVANTAKDAAVAQAEWLAPNKSNPQGKSNWSLEKDKLPKDTRLDQAGLNRIFDAYRNLVVKHGPEKFSERINQLGLVDLKVKQTTVLRSVKDSNQVFSDAVIVGYSKQGLDGKHFVVIEPSTGNPFYGRTEDEAMANYCKGASLEANTKIAFRDSKGIPKEGIVTIDRVKGVAYRVGLALVIVGSLVASGGGSAAPIATAAAVVGTATMATVDISDLRAKAANGEPIKWTDYATVGADVLLGVILPTSQLGKLRKMSDLAKAEQAAKFLSNPKNELLAEGAVKELESLRKNNPQEYIKKVDQYVKQAAIEKPEVFTKALKITSQETTKPFQKGGAKVEDLFYFDSKGNRVQISTIKTQLSEKEALAKFEKLSPDVKSKTIYSGKNFVISENGVLKTQNGKAVFHVHPQSKAKPEFLQSGKTYATLEQIVQVYQNLGISGADLIHAARTDGKVRIIIQGEKGGYYAVEVEVQFQDKAKGILKSIKVGNVVFNEALVKSSKIEQLEAFAADIEKHNGAADAALWKEFEPKFLAIHKEMKGTMERTAAEAEYFETLVKQGKNLATETDVNTSAAKVRSLGGSTEPDKMSALNGDTRGKVAEGIYRTKVAALDRMIADVRAKQVKVSNAFNEALSTTAITENTGRAMSEGLMPLKTDLKNIASQFKTNKISREVALIELKKLRDQINDRIGTMLRGEYAKGHAYAGKVIKDHTQIRDVISDMIAKLK